MILNIPTQIEKKVLNNIGVVESFERGGFKYFVKASETETNRLVIDHIEAGQDLILRYVAKDAKTAEPIAPKAE